MMRIGPAASGHSLTAQQQLQESFAELGAVSQRLATLHRINRGSDDPAGLIAAEELRAQLRTAEETSAAAERIRGSVRVADSAMARAGEQLNDIQGHLVAAANAATPAEREALQVEIDAALDAIDLIGHTTRFGGRAVLDGRSIEFFAGGPTSDPATLEMLHLDSDQLGSSEGSLRELRSGNAASVDGDLQRASQIVAGAREMLTTARARGGAFERATLDSTQSVLADQIANVSSSLSSIVDTDVVAEASSLSRSLVQIETSTLAARFSLFAERTAHRLLDDLLATDR